MKKTALYLIFAFVCALSCRAVAQYAFWNYDDLSQEMLIPPECDGVFDETRGGVFLPPVQELANRGEAFLLNPDPVERNKAGYCLIAAALKGHVPSQYRVSQLYAKGIVLPQDDLSAYRWAFLASLNGHEEASRHALLLERFLTTQEIELATSSLQALLPDITRRHRGELNAQQQRVNEKQKELDRVNDEIDILLGIKKAPSPLANASPDVRAQAQKATPGGAVFTEKDRIKL